MKKFGLIGYPIDKSKSPALFEAGYAGKYRYDLIENKDFTKSYRTFLEGYDGINVTAPFKEDAFRQADIIAESAVGIGAANLLVKTPAGIKAYNTDYAGIILSIIDGVLPEGGYGYFTLYESDLTTIKKILPIIYGRKPKALIAGCGGAGKAACVAAADMGYEVTIINRTESKAEDMARQMPQYGFSTGKMEDFIRLFRENDLIIYTIPERIPEIGRMTDDDFRSKGKILLEANYRNPSFSGEMSEMMEGAGCRYISGKRWLLYQALAGYAIFTGENPDFKRMDMIL